VWLPTGFISVRVHGTFIVGKRNPSPQHTAHTTLSRSRGGAEAPACQSDRSPKSSARHRRGIAEPNGSNGASDPEYVSTCFAWFGRRGAGSASAACRAVHLTPPPPPLGLSSELSMDVVALGQLPGTAR